MKTVSFFINLITGLVFIVSAILKLFPIEYFEIKISGFGFGSEILMNVMARVIIAFEFILGAFLIFQIIYKGRLIRFVQLVLIGFIIINVIDIVITGNQGNCGCFGSAFQMSPLQSIFKNLFLIVILEISRRFSTVEVKLKYFWMSILLFLISLTTIIVFRPVYYNEVYSSKVKGTPLQLEIMDNHPRMRGKTFTDDLKKGKRIVAFLSLTCHYCKLGGYKLSILKSKHPELPVFFILNGDSTNLPEFEKFTNAKIVPRAHFNGREDFMELSGNILPAIYLLEDKIIYSKESYTSIDEEKILKWYKGK